MAATDSGVGAARAALDATAYATRELVDAMVADAGVALPSLRVDGGMTANGLLMQIQADALGLPVTRPSVTETTALGAAYAAANDLPFAAIRVISDPAIRALPPLAARALKADGRIDFGAVLSGLARAPMDISTLIRAGGDAGKAPRTLALSGADVVDARVEGDEDA